jgi:hypothetical protein
VDFDPPLFRRFSGGFGHERRFEKPLAGFEGLDRRGAPVTGGNRVAMVFHFHQEAQRFQFRHDFFAAFFQREFFKPSGPGGHFSIKSDHHFMGQVVARADLEIGGVVGRGHLDRAGAKRSVHGRVGDNGDHPIHEREF